jgi:all-trans-retinol 13,14-reductase
MMGQHIQTDVVVIGAGTGGLTAAAYLAAAGRRVTVVDRGYAPGGHGSVFTREGFEFDIGLHYLGSTRTGAPSTKRLLDPLGIDVAYAPVEPTDTVVLADGQRFEVPRGLEAYRAALHAALPDERAAIDRYLGTVDTVDALVAQLGRTPAPAEVPTTLRRAGVVLRRARDTVGGYWDQLGFSPRARTLLGWFQGTYAVAPSEASLLYHCVLTMAFVNGGWYPRGGGAVISDRLADVVTGNGGQFLQRHEVTQITVDDERVTGVVATDPDGETVTVSASTVVAAGDIKQTFLSLLDPAVVPRKLARRVRGYEMALPLAVLYLVVERDLAAEGIPATNFMVVPEDDLQGTFDQARRGEFADEPFVWVTSASLKDPNNPRLCPPGHTNLQLMTLAPPQPAAWGLKVGEQRGEAYQAAKDELTRQMLKVADRSIPGLSDTAVYTDLATPYTETRYMGVTDGTSYGIAATPDQMLWDRPGPTGPIPGLYLAGASTRTGHGITGTMIGGIGAASAILGQPAVKAVRARQA